MSSVQYELSVSSIAKIDAMVTVRDDGNYENETFLFNYITKAEYDAISGDKTAGLKAHMDAFIDARVNSHPNSGVMTRKEFLSRALMNGKEDLFVPIEIGGLTPGTTYYLYVFGLKADGTYTTEPVTTQFTTVADQVTLASLEFIVMSYGYPEENRERALFSVVCRRGRVGWQDGFRSEGAAQSVQVAQFKLIQSGRTIRTDLVWLFRRL